MNILKIFFLLSILTLTSYAQNPLSVSVKDLAGSTVPTGTCQSGARYTQTLTQPVLWICGSNSAWKKVTIENFTSSCEILLGDPSATSLPLVNDNDAPAVCTNTSSSNQEIISVSCYANEGSPTVLPKITGSGENSILTGNLTCGNGSYTFGTLNGTPALSTNGTIDGNIVSAGSAKYIIIRIIKRII